MFNTRKTFNDITIEEIVSLHLEALENEQVLYDTMKEYSSGKLKGERFDDPSDEIKTVALHSHFIGWKTGHWTAIIDMANELIELGYKVYLLHHTLPPVKFIKNTEAQMIKLPEHDESDEEKCISTFKAIGEVCQTYEIDAVILNSYYGWGKYTDYLAFKRVILPHSKRTVRCILQFHTSFQRDLAMEGSVGSDWLTNNAPCLGIYDGILVESEVDKRLWSAYNPNVFFRPLKIMEDVGDFQLSTLDSKEIVYIARFSNNKNQKELIKAMEIVADEVPDAKLILMGDGGDYLDECKRYVQENGLADNIIFTGYVEGDKKYEYIRDASIAISTSRFEGYPIALAECKCCGLPLVMYDIPNLTIRDGVEENGTVVVPQNDIDAMAQAIIDLLTNDERRKELGRRARAHMEEIYSIDYDDLWRSIFSADAKSNEYIEDEVQQRLYKVILDSFAGTYRNAASKIEELNEKIEFLENGGDMSELENKDKNKNEKSDIDAQEKKTENNYMISRGTIKLDAPAKGFMDRYIIFNKKFNKKPHVVCSIYSSATTPDIVNITCTAINVTTNGCVLRVFNNSKVDRTPAVTYIAVGE